jgi:hypothetical protein
MTGGLFDEWERVMPQRRAGSLGQREAGNNKDQPGMINRRGRELSNPA